MIVLDTDHISLLQHSGSAEGERLGDRMAASADADIVTTVVTVEEQMRGWLQAIAHPQVSEQPIWYDRLIAFVRFFAQWRILRFDERAAAEFASLQQARVRIATTDLKIAAIALTADATLLSRNSRNFQRVPGLRSGGLEQAVGPSRGKQESELTEFTASPFSQVLPPPPRERFRTHP